jgi:omega-6 fatty acid desaturase (delta-12 desaturase)
MRQPDWSFHAAAIDGSSYLKLPRMLQWMTGNIGFHHIHHLSPRVPNYRLEECQRGAFVLRDQTPMTIGKALKGGNLTLWDEAKARLVRFKDVHRAEREGQAVI